MAHTPRPHGPDRSQAPDQASEATQHQATHQAPEADLTALAAAPPSRTSRGTQVYIALSLSNEQARRAEAWALAAGCSVAFLIRRVAQSVRKEIVAESASCRIEISAQQRHSHGRNPTSVTLTLPEPLAQSLQASLDPFGLLGLGRALSPAFRVRFASAFDAACDRAGF